MKRVAVATIAVLAVMIVCLLINWIVAVMAGVMLVPLIAIQFEARAERLRFAIAASIVVVLFAGARSLIALDHLFHCGPFSVDRMAALLPTTTPGDSVTYRNGHLVTYAQGDEPPNVLAFEHAGEVQWAYELQGGQSILSGLEVFPGVVSDRVDFVGSAGRGTLRIWRLFGIRNHYTVCD